MDLKGLNNKEIEKIIENETKERTVSFWGQKHTIKPCLIEKTHGDGLQLVYLTPIDTRPNYYVLRIDSGIDVGDDDSLSYEDERNYGSVKEILLQMVEDEHINIGNYEENDDGKYYQPFDESIEPFDYEFPMLRWEGGMWGNL